jgi:sugar phosphate permease
VACGVWQEKLVADAGNQLNFNRKLTMWTIFVENIFLNKILWANKYYIPAYQRLIPC